MPTRSGVLNGLSESSGATGAPRLNMVRKKLQRLLHEHTDRETGIAMTAELYVQRDPEAVARFLRDHDSLMGYLIDTHPVIREVFTPGFLDASLTWQPDPEEDYDYLVVDVRTRLSPDECLERMRQFDDCWWLDLPFEVRNNVVVTVRPR